MARIVKVCLDVMPPREEWCDRCLTTSLVVVDIMRLRDTGVELVESVRKCWRCD